MTPEIYLDANATTCVLPAAAASALRVMNEQFGNPSSTHYTGLRAKELMASVRSRASRLLGADSGQLLFVSGATEAIQTAVLSALCAVRERRTRGTFAGKLLVVGATEHKAVPESLAHWNRLLGLDLELRLLPVDAGGQHDLDALRGMAEDAALVCTMAANNETGCRSDLVAIGEVLRQSTLQPLWLVDCVQALGKLPLNLVASGIDYAAFSGHKLYAPKGIGLLYVRSGAPFTPLMVGGGQEDGQRSGTENMAGIAALGSVLEALEDGDTFRSHHDLFRLRDLLVASLWEALPGLVFNAPLDKTLPTTLNFSVPGFASKELLDLFDAAGVRVSSGSACSAAKAAPSFVLEAMGLPAWQAAAAVRMSFGPAVSDDLIHQACERIRACGSALRASGLSGATLQTAPDDGLLQWSADGASTWLLLDAASRSCIVLDPLPALAQRLLVYVRNHRLRVVAVLITSTSPEHAANRLALAQQLDEHLDTAAISCDPTGWPAACSDVTLGNNEVADALALGPLTLARFTSASGQAYLLGEAQDKSLQPARVRFAFTSTVALAGCATSNAAPAAETSTRCLVDVIHSGTLLCACTDAPGRLASTPRADAQPSRADEHSEIHLCARTLARFLDQHADALLVDVREPFERLAGPLPATAGRPSLHVPLSRLVNQLHTWLEQGDPPRPLVFVCRSGNRSGRAAACMRRLGYPMAWHLAGGLALTTQANG